MFFGHGACVLVLAQTSEFRVEDDRITLHTAPLLWLYSLKVKNEPGPSRDLIAESDNAVGVLPA